MNGSPDEYPMIPPELFAHRMEPHGWLRPTEARGAFIGLANADPVLFTEPGRAETVWDRMVQSMVRKGAELEEQDAIRRFRRNLTTVDPWAVPRPDTSWDCVYGTLEEQYPGAAEVARKGLTAKAPAPPAGNPKPCFIEGKEHWPRNSDAAQCVDLMADPRARWDIPGKAMENLREAANTDLWGFLKPKPLWGLAPGHYAITPLPDGLLARQVTPGNGWGHVAIVEAGPEYVERPDHQDDYDDDDGWEEAEGQEWVDQQAEERAECLADFIVDHLAADETDVGAPWVDADDRRHAIIDGTFDLVALAKAVITLLEESKPIAGAVDAPPYLKD